MSRCTLLSATLCALLVACLALAQELGDEPHTPDPLHPIVAVDLPPITPSPEEVFLEAWHVVNNAFYDPDMHGVDWEAVREELLPLARDARNAEELSGTINRALDRLHASHTAHYTPMQREYYELLDVFYPRSVPQRPNSPLKPGPVEYVGVGLVSTVIDGRVFAADVCEAGPAARAGVMVGDALISVEGQPWSDIEAFADREGQETRIVVQRSPREADRMELIVVPERIRPRALFLESMREGARIIERDGMEIAYVRVRSYAHPDYHELLKELIFGPLREADGLVIDLRGGWGGASTQYLDIFNPIVPQITMRERDGSIHRFNTTWRKPLVVMIDGGSRSGKEVLAYAIRKHDLATLVGQRTAGAVLGGTPRPLADGSLLYVAVRDVRVDGQTLEGVGVEPHVHVEREIPFCAGRDEQLDAAVDVVISQCREMTLRQNRE